MDLSQQALVPRSRDSKGVVDRGLAVPTGKARYIGIPPLTQKLRPHGGTDFSINRPRRPVTRIRNPLRNFPSNQQVAGGFLESLRGAFSPACLSGQRDWLKPVRRLKSAPPRLGLLYPHRWSTAPSRLPRVCGPAPTWIGVECAGAIRAGEHV